MRAKVIKAVGRPADIYSLGALFYYLVSGAYGNPKSLYDSFRKFIEYERKDKTNTVRDYIEHEYGIIQNLRAPKNDEERIEVAPEDRFFSYKQYLDGGGELIDKEVMYIIAPGDDPQQTRQLLHVLGPADHRHLGDGARSDGPVRALRREPLGARRLPAARPAGLTPLVVAPRLTARDLDQALGASRASWP